MDARPAQRVPLLRRVRFFLLWRTGLMIALVLLKLFDIAMLKFGYRRLCRWLIWVSPRPNPNRLNMRHAFVLGRLVNQAAEDHAFASCLRRSLVTWWIMRWANLPADLRIGMQLQDLAQAQAGSTQSQLDRGHSWVEHGGQVINDHAKIASLYPIDFSDRLTPEKIIHGLKASA